MSERRRVLIVDDEKEIAVLFGFLLTHHGFETDIAYNGKEALEKLNQQSFDYVISDVRMPVMDGAELFRITCETIRPKPRFIFISGFEDLLDEDALAESLAKFTKPVNHEQIVDVLLQHMGTEEAC